MTFIKKPENFKDYKSYKSYKVIFIIILFLLTIFATIWALSSGSAKFTMGDVLKTLLGNGSQQNDLIIFNIRLPRIVMTILCGVGLAMTGCIMQSLLKNPLASASTLGVSQGASFGAAFAIIAFGAGMMQSKSADAVNINNPYLITICSFIGAMGATVFILMLSKYKKITPEAMVLVGVAISSIFTGGTTLLQYFADDIQLSAIVFWTFGDLGRVNWQEIFIVLVIVLIALGYFYFNRWNYNALETGEESAKGIGVNVEKTRIIGMIICSLTAACIVGFVGIINFIGLIAPHIMRRCIGNDYRYLIPASAITGALLLLVSDTFARTIISPIILPIGAITSFLGAPLFLYILFRGVSEK